MLISDSLLLFYWVGGGGSEKCFVFKVHVLLDSFSVFVCLVADFLSSHL